MVIITEGKIVRDGFISSLILKYIRRGCIIEFVIRFVFKLMVLV